jgi:hypothetical protein
VKNKYLVIIICSFWLTYCDYYEKVKTEKECAEKKDVGQDIYFDFHGYFHEDLDSIDICIKRINGAVFCYPFKIPEEIDDSMRHERSFRLNTEILLSDTLYVKIKNEPVTKMYGFKYKAILYNQKFDHYYDCDLSAMVNGEPANKGGNCIHFWKKGFEILDSKKDFKTYYKY